VGDTLGGIGAIFAISSAWQCRQGAGRSARGLLGVSDQKRKLAVKFGVDPYTDFAPLDDKLSRLSEAAAAGGSRCRVRLLRSQAPPASSSPISRPQAPSKTSRSSLGAPTNTAAQTLRPQPPAARRHGRDKDLIEGLLANRNYTPIDMAAWWPPSTACLSSGPHDIPDFAQCGSTTARIAYFMRSRPNSWRGHHRRAQGVQPLGAACRDWRAPRLP